MSKNVAGVELGLNPGLRERNKAGRREALLDAALTLLDQRPAEEISAAAVARVAGLSTATLYNLVGGRQQLFMALVDRLVESVVASLPHDRPAGIDAVQQARLVIDHCIDALTARSTAYRQVALSFGVRSEVPHTMLDPSLVATEMVRAAQDEGILRPDMDPHALGRQVYLSFNGALFRWAVGGLTDQGLRVMAHHGLLCVVCAGATEPHWHRYHHELVELGTQIAPEYR